MRGATAQRPINDGLVPFQSTLLMRGATWIPPRKPCRLRNFNPRSSCEERQCRALTVINVNHFNPRSSCEERPPLSCTRTRVDNFNPRSSCEERHFDACRAVRLLDISIHAPHARSDLVACVTLLEISISIHAPHARSDDSFNAHMDIVQNFNPRSSCEERLLSAAVAAKDFLFQSTLLMRGATIVLQ